MMRVIAGSARGMGLVAPRDRTIRPITDRTRETLFAIVGERVIDATVLDLYAGSGAIGIEALSRGARHAAFVDRSRSALEAIRQNLGRTGLGGAASVHEDDVVAYLGRAPGSPIDLAVLDPPYEERAILAPLERLIPHLAPGATVVLKHFWKTEVPEPPGLTRTRSRRLGETMLTFLEARPDRSRVGAIVSRIAVFPGSFDPMTNAHLDVARRAASLFDRLIVGVLRNPKKAPLFSVEDRIELIRASVADFGANVAVEGFDGLTVEFAVHHEAGFVVRGLRAVSDFEAELQMAHTNRKLSTGVDTVFLMTALEYGYLSSSLAKEVAQFAGEVSGMVPPPVAEALRARFAVGS